MAPKAAQIIYEGPNSPQGINDTYNQIVTDKKAQIATTSWGLCESLSGNAELQTLDNILSQGAAESISVYAASGDSGAYDCTNSTLAVDSPASDPNITGVGGTNLQLTNGAYGSETVWSNPSDTQRSSHGAGGGGGISSFFKEPGWQTGPSVQNQYSNGNREVPDVSADADPASGYSVYCTVAGAGCPSSGWITVAGTSAAAPLWAGGTELINEYLQKQQKSPLGFANPVLYGLQNAQQFPPFHDITSGNNLYYPASAGYDEASGWGSSDIYNIARDVAAGVSPPPSPTPTPGPSPTATATVTPSPMDTTTPSPGPTVTTMSVPSPTTTTMPVPIPTQPAPTNSLIQNGGFEQGNAPWQAKSAAGYELVDATNPHSGSYSAFLCGYSNCSDSIGQNFTIPANVSNITISYWWYAGTNRTSSSCKDIFLVNVSDSSGNVIGQVESACNSHATQSWRQVTLNVTGVLSKYAGQAVTLTFVAKTTADSATSSFYVDDVAVTV